MYRLRIVIVLVLLANSFSQSAELDLEQRIRRPVALALSENGQWLYTANRNSGSISVIDTSARCVVEEINVGGRLSDIVVLDDAHLLALDEQNHQLVMLTGDGAQWSVAARLGVAKFPVRLCVEKETNRCFISSLWSRAVTVVDLSETHRRPEPRLRVGKKVLLSFEPREMSLANDGKNLIIAGSFTNTLAVFETSGFELVAVKQLPGHNIRGLAVSHDGKRLFLAQQELHPLARSTRDDVHWGNMISNLIVSLSLNDVCDPQADILKRRVVHYLGEPGNAAGDPGALDVSPEGKLAVLLSGVNELALGLKENENDFQRIPVGSRPSAIVSANDGTTYVANMFSDTVSIVDGVGKQPVKTVTLGPQLELSPAELGETLFFDSRLSHDGWMSCHSCHTDGHSNGQLNDNLSDGSFDAAKRVLSLLGVSRTAPWAWNGEVKSLEDQVRRSIKDTMHGTKLSQKQVTALVAFMKTLAAPPPLQATFEDKRSDVEGRNTDKIGRGRELFRSLECQNCHAPPVYTTALAYDVGLADAVGTRKFNPPSLRGVARRAAFFHDASAKSLRDVFLKHKHQLNRALTAAELESLLLFLQSI